MPFLEFVLVLNSETITPENASKKDSKTPIIKEKISRNKSRLRTKMAKNSLTPIPEIEIGRSVNQ